MKTITYTNCCTLKDGRIDPPMSIQEEIGHGTRPIWDGGLSAALCREGVRSALS